MSQRVRILSFRAPIDVSSVRVGTTYGEPGGDLASPPKSPAPEESSFMRAAHAVGGYAFPVEVSVATVAGGAVGLLFGGWFWGLLGAIGSNVAGRTGGAAYCRNTPHPTGYAAGKCGGGGPKAPIPE